MGIIRYKMGIIGYKQGIKGYNFEQLYLGWCFSYRTAAGV